MMDNIFKAHVIHNPLRTERMEQLKYEAETQKIDMQIWPAIMHEHPTIGCLVSHKQIVQYAKDHSLPQILIMEDDVRFCGPGAFHHYCNHQPSDYDLYLAGVYYQEINADKTLRKFSATHCYMIRDCFYNTLLELPETPQFHIDELLTEKGKYYVCEPHTAVQYPGYSDNVRDHVNYDWFFKDTPLYNDFKL